MQPGPTPERCKVRGAAPDLSPSPVRRREQIGSYVCSPHRMGCFQQRAHAVNHLLSVAFQVAFDTYVPAGSVHPALVPLTTIDPVTLCSARVPLVIENV